MSLANKKENMASSNHLFQLGNTLNLQRPLAFFDLETTSTNRETAKIVEIAILKIDLNHEKSEYLTRINPGEPIPADSSAIHGIFDADVAEAPKFCEIAPQIIEFLEGCDLAGFNSNKFDIPILMIELDRCGLDLQIESRKLIDVMTLYRILAPRNLTSAYKQFCGKDLLNAHSALADITATYEVLMAQVANFENIPGDVSQLHTICQSDELIDPYGRFRIDENNHVVFAFGKYRNVPVKEVGRKDPGYIRWVKTTDFPAKSLKILEQELQGS